MSDDTAQGRALRPLWLLTTAAVTASAATTLVVEPGSPQIRWLLIGAGAAALLAALHRGRDAPAILWFAAGLALVGGRGLGAADDHLRWRRLETDDATVVHARAVLSEGWVDSRWGRRSRVRVLSAEAGGTVVVLPRRCRIEVRGSRDGTVLPAPGTELDFVARPTGEFDQPLLVVSSPRLVRGAGKARWLPGFRDRLARALMSSAGTNVERIRAAELAAALALGRRDLMASERRDRWRRSGFAHLLAVSGLHVGVVGGSLWLMATLLGASPRSARLVCLVAIPSYTILTGASPSALRAALMGVIYLGARFLGRAVVPMGAVLLAALLLLFTDPGMIVQPGFQLTVVITAALVRWVPPVTSVLPGPIWLTGTAAVPLVAQTAALPIVAAHFRSLIPGATVANILAMPLLPPTVLLSLGATFVAPVWTGGAAAAMSALGALTRVLDTIGGPARASELVAPGLHPVMVLLLAALGWMTLQTGRKARWAAALWIATLTILNLRLFLPPRIADPTVEVLPVADGEAVLMAYGRDSVLADTGRFPREAATLTADAGRRHLQALLVSHTDEDHAGGAIHALRTLRVERLVVPGWMPARKEAVPLLRAARDARTPVVPVARGSTISLGEIRLTVLWPPALDAPRDENERSLVARFELGPVTTLFTSDIGRATERRLASSSRLGCDVLIVPHHGSRGSSSPRLLDAASPTVALVPAAPTNIHGHPHWEVLQRLAARRITVGTPSENESGGARWDGHRWIVTGRY